MLKVIHMVTTQNIAIGYMQKRMRNDLNITLQKKKNQLNTKEDRNAENEGQKP